MQQDTYCTSEILPARCNKAAFKWDIVIGNWEDAIRSNQQRLLVRIMELDDFVGMWPGHWRGGD